MLQSTIGQIALFTGSLALSIVSSIVMAYRVDQVGAALGLSEGLLGIVTALGADAPEISAAVTALSTGQHDLGLGVIFGSNIFNFAALLGLSAAVVGRIHMRRRGLVLDASVALWVTLAAAIQALGIVSTPVTFILLAVVVVPYVALFLLGNERLAAIGLPDRLGAWLADAVGGVRKDARGDETPRAPNLIDKLSLIPLLATVVLSSIGMVNSASSLGAHWGISPLLTGTLVLAGLTGIPNMIAALRLAQAGRGAAVATETYTSNTINLLVGVFLPLALLGVGHIAGETKLAIIWLIGMTICAGLLCYAQRGMTRLGGGVLLALYAAFVAVTVWR